MRTIGKIFMVIVAFVFELIGRIARAISEMFISAAIMVLSAIKD